MSPENRTGFQLLAELPPPPPGPELPLPYRLGIMAQTYIEDPEDAENAWKIEALPDKHFDTFKNLVNERAVATPREGWTKTAVKTGVQLKRGAQRLVESTQAFGGLYVDPLLESVFRTSQTPEATHKARARQRELSDIRRSHDPIESEWENPALKWLGDGFYGAAGQAVPVTVGIATRGFGAGPATAYWVTQSAPKLYDFLRSRGIEEGLARGAAFGWSIPYAIVETLQIGQITKVAKGAFEASFRKAATEVLKTYGHEWGEEGIQGGIEMIALRMAQALSENAPEIDWKQVLQEKAEEFVQASGPLFWMVGLPGAGGYAAGRVARQMDGRIEPPTPPEGPTPESGPDPAGFVDVDADPAKMLADIAKAALSTTKNVDPTAFQAAANPEPVTSPPSIDVTPRSPTPAPDTPYDSFVGMPALRDAYAMGRNRAPVDVDPDAAATQGAAAKVVAGSPINDAWLELVLIGKGTTSRTTTKDGDFGGPDGVRPIPVIELEEASPRTVGHELGEAAWFLLETHAPGRLEEFAKYARAMGKQENEIPEFFSQLAGDYAAKDASIWETDDPNQRYAVSAMAGIMANPPAFSAVYGVDGMPQEDVSGLDNRRLAAELDNSRWRQGRADSRLMGQLGELDKLLIADPQLLQRSGFSDAAQLLTGELPPRAEGYETTPSDEALAKIRRVHAQEVAGRDAEFTRTQKIQQIVEDRAPDPGAVDAAAQQMEAARPTDEMSDDQVAQSLDQIGPLANQLAAADAEQEVADHAAGRSPQQRAQAMVNAVKATTGRDVVKEAESRGILHMRVTRDPTQRIGDMAFYNEAEIQGLAENMERLADFMVNVPYTPQSLMQTDPVKGITGQNIAIVPGDTLHFHGHGDGEIGYQKAIEVPREMMQGVTDAQAFANQLLAEIANKASPQMHIAGEVAAFANELGIDEAHRLGIDFAMRYANVFEGDFVEAIGALRPSAKLQAARDGGLQGGWRNLIAGRTNIFIREGGRKPKRQWPRVLQRWAGVKSDAPVTMRSSPGEHALIAERGGASEYVDLRDVRAISALVGRPVTSVSIEGKAISFARIADSQGVYAYIGTTAHPMQGEYNPAKMMQSLLLQGLASAVPASVNIEGEYIGAPDDTIPGKLARIQMRGGELWSHAFGGVKAGRTDATWDDIWAKALKQAGRVTAGGDPFVHVDEDYTEPAGVETELGDHIRLKWEDDQWTYFKDDGLYVHGRLPGKRTKAENITAAHVLQKLEAETGPLVRMTRGGQEMVAVMGQRYVGHAQKSALDRLVKLARNSNEEPFRYGATNSGHIALYSGDQIIGLASPVYPQQIYGHVMGEMAEGRYVPRAANSTQRGVYGEVDFSLAKNQKLATEIQQRMQWDKQGTLTWEQVNEAIRVLAPDMDKAAVIEVLDTAKGNPWRGLTLPQSIPRSHRRTFKQFGVKFDWRGRTFASESQWARVYNAVEKAYAENPASVNLRSALSWMRKNRLSAEQQATLAPDIPRLRDGSEVIDIGDLTLQDTPEGKEYAFKSRPKGPPSSQEVEGALKAVPLLAQTGQMPDSDIALEVGQISNVSGLTLPAEQMPSLARRLARKMSKRMGAFWNIWFAAPYQVARRMFGREVATWMADRNVSMADNKRFVAELQTTARQLVEATNSRKDSADSWARLTAHHQMQEVELDATETELVNTIERLVQFREAHLIQIAESAPSRTTEQGQQAVVLEDGITAEDAQQVLADMRRPRERYYLTATHKDMSWWYARLKNYIAESAPIQMLYGPAAANLLKVLPVDPTMPKTGLRGPSDVGFAKRIEMTFATTQDLMRRRFNVEWLKYMDDLGVYDLTGKNNKAFIPTNVEAWVKKQISAPAMVPGARLTGRLKPSMYLSTLAKPLTWLANASELFKALKFGFRPFGKAMLWTAQEALKEVPSKIWADMSRGLQRPWMREVQQPAGEIGRTLEQAGLAESRYGGERQYGVMGPSRVGKAAWYAKTPARIALSPLTYAWRKGFGTTEILTKIVTAKASEFYWRDHPQQLNALSKQIGRTSEQTITALQNLAGVTQQFAEGEAISSTARILKMLGGWTAFVRFQKQHGELIYTQAKNLAVRKWRDGGYKAEAARNLGSILASEIVLGLTLSALGLNIWRQIGPGKIPVTAMEDPKEAFAPDIKALGRFFWGLGQMAIRGREDPTARYNVARGLTDFGIYRIPGGTGILKGVEAVTDIDVAKTLREAGPKFMAPDGMDAQALYREMRYKAARGERSPWERFKTAIGGYSQIRADDRSAQKSLRDIKATERDMQGMVDGLLRAHMWSNEVGDTEDAEYYENRALDVYKALKERFPSEADWDRRLLKIQKRAIQPYIVKAVADAPSRTRWARAGSPYTARANDRMLRKARGIVKDWLSVMSDDQLELLGMTLPDERIAGQLVSRRLSGPRYRKHIKEVFGIKE